MLYANIVWFVVDVVILFQVLRYAKNDYPGISEKLLRLGILGILAISYGFVSLSERAQLRAVTSAFAQNFMMSALFIAMLIRRRSSAGQSLYIALSKALGTFVIVGPLFYKQVTREFDLMALLYLGILVLDVTYVLLLRAQLHQEGRLAWSRL